MVWPFSKKDKESELIGLVHGVPNGFFKCGKCGKVYSETKFGHSLWDAGKSKMLCKNCMDVGLKEPKIPERLRKK